METESIRRVDLSAINHLPTIDFIGNDFAIFNDIRDIPISGYPTRLNAVCFALCLQGNAQVNINLQDYEMQAGMMTIILPEQIVQQGSRSDDFQGLFIAISKSFIDGVVPAMQQLLPLFFQIKERPCIPLNAQEREAFMEYHSFLWKKVRLKDSRFRKEITQGLLVSLFYEIYDIYSQHADQVHRPKNRKEELFGRFLQLITEHYKQQRSVSFYAGKMFLSPKHLSTVIKAVSGKTAGEWIDGLVVLEAKALLRSTDMSVQEISDELHFSNQSFFGKYFKHHTGISPKEYRR
ncbi:MAG: helix-turn-helix transcriptional regulator [Bacteroides sp.]|nr:helix-turn-helix transcriptional regulator [Bacteroides sp.]